MRESVLTERLLRTTTNHHHHEADLLCTLLLPQATAHEAKPCNISLCKGLLAKLLLLHTDDKPMSYHYTLHHLLCPTHMCEFSLSLVMGHEAKPWNLSVSAELHVELLLRECFHNNSMHHNNSTHHYHALHNHNTSHHENPHQENI